MKAIIIDDERKAVQLLRVMLHEHCPLIEVVEDCEDLPSGIKAIKREQPQLVFLDIEMPGHSGLELLDFFNENEIEFDIIFTTAYSDYAIRAFKMSAIDYLLKPTQPQELIDAVERVQKKNHRLQSYKLLKENLEGNSKKIVINQSKGIEFLAADEILFLRGNGAYTEIHKTDGSFVMASKNLKHFEELLADQTNFFRTQKSYIVNIKHIQQIQKDEGNFFIAFDKHKVAISNEKLEELLILIKK